MSKILLHGTEAICEGAMRNGCRAFFGYPITPQPPSTWCTARRARASAP